MRPTFFLHLLTIICDRLRVEHLETGTIIKLFFCNLEEADLKDIDLMTKRTDYELYDRIKNIYFFPTTCRRGTLLTLFDNNFKRSLCLLVSWIVSPSTCR